jgi:hypothetical protein
MLKKLIIFQFEATFSKCIICVEKDKNKMEI